MRHRAPLLVLLAAAVALAAAPPAAACSCIEAPPPQEMAEMVDAVFTGKVVSFEDHERQTDYGRMLERRAVFAVDAVWKGLEEAGEEALAHVEVFTGRGGGDCGYRFEVGDSYMVYADEIDERLQTGICSRTRPVELAGPDLVDLGEPNVEVGGEDGDR